MLFIKSTQASLVLLRSKKASMESLSPDKVLQPSGKYQFFSHHFVVPQKTKQHKKCSGKRHLRNRKLKFFLSLEESCKSKISYSRKTICKIS